MIYTYNFKIGLRRWEEARAHWHSATSATTTATTATTDDTTTDDSSKSTPRGIAVPLDVDEIIDIIFSPRWRMPGHELGPPRRFPQNVPLTQMVDVLVDLWEAEGLDV